MGKYSSLETEIYSVFGSTAWKGENIPTFPANFLVNNTNEYIRVSIIPSSPGVNLNSVSGILLIDIFAKSGKGTKSINMIADKLDDYLMGISLLNDKDNIQFFESNLTMRGTDKDNSSLYKALYSIKFNFFRGV